MNQIRAGAVLSYVSMALSTIISLVYTPIMLERLGDSEFGVYQAVLPIISYLNLLSFGLGSAYVRYYSRFRATGDKRAAPSSTVCSSSPIWCWARRCWSSASACPTAT